MCGTLNLFLKTIFFVIFSTQVYIFLIFTNDLLNLMYYVNYFFCMQFHQCYDFIILINLQLYFSILYVKLFDVFIILHFVFDESYLLCVNCVSIKCIVFYYSQFKLFG